MDGGLPFHVQPQAWPQPYVQPRPQPPRPTVVRPVRGEEPLQAARPAARVAIPTWEEIKPGLSSPPARPDAHGSSWAATRAQLTALGAREYSLSARPGGWRFRIVLPGKGPIDGEGADEAQAIANALAQARASR
jgi:hypothetical protein